MAPTTITSICLVLFGLGVLALTAYGYYLVLWAGESLRDREDDRQRRIDAAISDLRRQIDLYERGDGRL